MNATKNEYIPPVVEIIPIETEEVVALSNMGGGTPPNPTIAYEDYYPKK